ncbi:hypothetical protein [Psychromarinibacter sp. S121]|uniref:hypothetical protein n=1 Tax=Psychromarinibacter sp. S121 TaxID=3415127 RepID=UPI003C7E0622
MRAILAASLLLAAAPALADQTSGTVALYDAASHQLTFTDHTVWYLPASLEMPLGVVPGDVLQINYTTNSDNGWQAIQTVRRLVPLDGAKG